MLSWHDALIKVASGKFLAKVGGTAVADGRASDST